MKASKYELVLLEKIRQKIGFSPDSEGAQQVLRDLRFEDFIAVFEDDKGRLRFPGASTTPGGAGMWTFNRGIFHEQLHKSKTSSVAFRKQVKNIKKRRRMFYECTDTRPAHKNENYKQLLEDGMSPYEQAALGYALTGFYDMFAYSLSEHKRLKTYVDVKTALSDAIRGDHSYLLSKALSYFILSEPDFVSRSEIIKKAFQNEGQDPQTWAARYISESQNSPNSMHAPDYSQQIQDMRRSPLSYDNRLIDKAIQSGQLFGLKNVTFDSNGVRITERPEKPQTLVNDFTHYYNVCSRYHAESLENKAGQKITSLKLRLKYNKIAQRLPFMPSYDDSNLNTRKRVVSTITTVTLLCATVFDVAVNNRMGIPAAMALISATTFFIHHLLSKFVTPIHEIEQNYVRAKGKLVNTIELAQLAGGSFAAAHNTTRNQINLGSLIDDTLDTFDQSMLMDVATRLLADEASMSSEEYEDYLGQLADITLPKSHLARALKWVASMRDPLTPDVQQKIDRLEGTELLSVSEFSMPLDDGAEQPPARHISGLKLE